MSAHTFTDEQLMAFADGEADFQTGSEINEALRSDPRLAAKIAMFTASGNLARQSQPLEPVPAALEDKIRALAAKSAAGGADALPLRQAANSNFASWRLPLAASVALAIGLACGYLANSGRSSATDGLQIANFLDPAAEAALNTVPAGSRQQLGDDLFTAIASFKNASGQLCREFERDFKSGAFVVGVACLENDRWSAQAVIASARSDGGYAPASSMDAIEAYLSAIGAGPVLPPAEEAAALSN